MALLDQQMALQWIRDNARNLGGDPEKVALFGESAGAASIVAHLIAPASHGLFRYGILQSGSLDNRWFVSSLFQTRFLVRLNYARRGKISKDNVLVFGAKILSYPWDSAVMPCQNKSSIYSLGQWIRHTELWTNRIRLSTSLGAI